MPLGSSPLVNVTALLKIFNVSSNHEKVATCSLLRTYYTMPYLLKFMEVTKLFSWLIQWSMYSRTFAVSCSVSKGNISQTAFKKPNRVVVWKGFKWKSFIPFHCEFVST